MDLTPFSRSLHLHAKITIRSMYCVVAILRTILRKQKIIYFVVFSTSKNGILLLVWYATIHLALIVVRYPMMHLALPPSPLPARKKHSIPRTTVSCEEFDVERRPHNKPNSAVFTNIAIPAPNDKIRQDSIIVLLDDIDIPNADAGGNRGPELRSVQRKNDPRPPRPLAKERIRSAQ